MKKTSTLGGTLGLKPKQLPHPLKKTIVASEGSNAGILNNCHKNNSCTTNKPVDVVHSLLFYTIKDLQSTVHSFLC
jgi:hypothetical protein